MPENKSITADVKSKGTSESVIVSIIVSVYNKEEFLEKSLESLHAQTMSPDKFEVIVVDDKSTDSSPQIIEKYFEKFKNAKMITLAQNSGTPSTPRNYAIDYIEGKYTMFLDGDDHLAPIAIEKLSSILEETDDDYVTGRSISFESEKKSKFYALYESYSEQRNADIRKFPKIFNHLGPRSKMLKTEIIKENNIKFPLMKYGEDKQFYMEYILNCKTYSTTETIIHYLNRAEENHSIVKQTDYFYKADANKAVLIYLNSLKGDETLKAKAYQRLLEFDFITRHFKRKSFLSESNKMKYIDFYTEVLDLVPEKEKEIVIENLSDYNKLLHKFAIEKNIEAMTELVKWSFLGELQKPTINIDDVDYYQTPYGNILKDLECIFLRIVNKDKKKYIEFTPYGDKKETVNKAIFISQTNIYDYLTADIINVEGRYYIDITEIEEEANVDRYNIFIIYNDYVSIRLRRSAIRSEIEVAESKFQNILYRKNKEFTAKKVEVLKTGILKLNKKEIKIKSAILYVDNDNELLNGKKIDFSKKIALSREKLDLEQYYQETIIEEIIITKACYRNKTTEFTEEDRLGKIKVGDIVRPIGVVYSGTKPRFLLEDNSFITASKDFYIVLKKYNN